MVEAEALRDGVLGAEAGWGAGVTGVEDGCGDAHEASSAESMAKATSFRPMDAKEYSFFGARPQQVGARIGGWELGLRGVRRSLLWRCWPAAAKVEGPFVVTVRSPRSTSSTTWMTRR